MEKDLFEYLQSKEQQILEYIKSDTILDFIKPNHINEGVLSYLFRPAKRLRPSILLIASGCTGGKEKELQALPAAVGVELFHAWTLIHDDIIDNDSLRRGGPTIHSLIEDQSKSQMGLTGDLAKKYGTDIAILSGDMLHGWAISAFIDCALKIDINPHIILCIIKHLETYTLGNLIYGETIDIQFGLTDNYSNLLDISEERVVEMLWLKTGVLYEFAGMAGAMIGKETLDIKDNEVQSIKNFTGKCGIAFQLHDDILGILGDEKVLGKSIGSDIRQGKKTTIVLESLKNATEEQRNYILRVLADKACKESEIKGVTKLFLELNGIDHTKKLAIDYINNAIPFLDSLTDSYYKRLLYQWAEHMVNRNFERRV